MSSLAITIRQVHDVVILVCVGAMTSAAGENAFLKPVSKLITDYGYRKFIVDFGEVDHLDSHGIGQLAAVLGLLEKEKGGCLRLVKLNGKVRSHFITLKLDTIFQTFNDEASALASFD